MSNAKETIEALNPDPKKQGTRVSRTTYEAFKNALLKAIPTSEEGIEFMALSKAVKPHVDEKILENSSLGWWTTTVKLDLEARGLIERIPGKGRQRIRKVK